MASSVDWKFIEKYECSTSFGYIPARKHGMSGVTVGMGFDIGAHSPAQIKAYFPNDKKLREKLLRFAGKSGSKAREMYKSQDKDANAGAKKPCKLKTKAIKCGPDRSAWIYQPGNKESELLLTTTEIDKLNKVVHDKKLSVIVKIYNASAKKKQTPAFTDLPSEIQTAIVSFQWQYGEYVGTIKSTTDRRRKLFEAYTSNDWGKVTELLAGAFKKKGDVGISRRQEELELVKKLMTKAKNKPDSKQGTNNLTK